MGTLDRSNSDIKNMINSWKEKYQSKDKKRKIVMVVSTIFFLFCLLRIISFIFSGASDGLPNCNDKNLVDKKLPALILSHFNKAGYSTAGASVIISKPEESYYDGKAGIRQCTAVMTLKKSMNIEAIDMEYQIAWVNKKTGEYQYRILE